MRTHLIDILGIKPPLQHVWNMSQDEYDELKHLIEVDIDEAYRLSEIYKKRNKT